MSHHGLNNLDVRLILAKPGAKSVPCDMAAEPRDHPGLAAITSRPYFFPFIVIINNPLDLPVDARRSINIAKAVEEYKSL